MAWSMSSTSSPRTSPTTIRSGRIRSALRTEVALRDLALAFDVGRAGLEPHHVRLLQHELGRVLDGDDALVGRDVAREDVEQRGLAGAGAAGHQHVEPGRAPRRSPAAPFRRSALPSPIRSSIDSARRRKRRIERIGPSSAAGGMIALTREPSGRRASTSGVDSSMRRPTREMMRSMMWPQVRFVAERDRRSASSLPSRSTYTWRWVLTRMSLISSSSSSGVIGPRSKVSWSSSGDQALLVARACRRISASTSMRRARCSTWARRWCLVEALEHGEVELGDQLTVELLLDDLVAVRLGFGRTHGESGPEAGVLAVAAPEAMAKIHGSTLSEQAHAAGTLHVNGPDRLFDRSPRGPALRARALMSRAALGVRRARRTAACRR